MARTTVLAVFLVVPLLGGCLGARDEASPIPTDTLGGYELARVFAGLDQPLQVLGAGDGSGRIFVVEQTGKVWVFREGEKSSEPFLDVSDHVSGGSEQGLLSIAFHPSYESNGRVFVSYTDTAGDSRIEEYRVSEDDPDRLEDGPVKTILTQDQPFSNHNGGLVTFGPDGYLYIGFGDGGDAGDPFNNGQSLFTWLGKILRIDVDHGDPYEVPEDNPFSGTAEKREIWAYGLRNPWRFSFDRETDDLFIADVGQNTWEEVNLQPSDSRGGENYGWRVYEGNHDYLPGVAPNHAPPVAEYQNGPTHCSVTGGHVYRGATVPLLQGKYVLGDYCSGVIWTMERTDGNWHLTQILDTDLLITSFGEDDDGELYVVDQGGTVHRFVPAPVNQPT